MDVSKRKRMATTVARIALVVATLALAGEATTWLVLKGDLPGLDAYAAKRSIGLILVAAALVLGRTSVARRDARLLTIALAAEFLGITLLMPWIGKALAYLSS